MSNTANQNPETERLLTLAETAERLRVKVQTIEAYVQKRLIGCYRTNGKILISEQKHLRVYLESCEQPAQN